MKKQAFTIVETLVTLLAITIMISAPLAFMVRSHSYAEIIRNKTISTGLAQEGLELFTAFRNKDLATFKNAIELKCKTPIDNGGCSIDWNGEADDDPLNENITVDSCQDDECQLYKPSGEEATMYRTNKITGEPTGFYRYLNVSPNGSQSYTVESISYSYVNEVKVSVKIKKVISNIEIK